ncbi:hypothetical protein DMO17_18755 [Aquipseudomonas alcaligenes]|uniref:Uncharacterized protein n=1 Tax=Aquipseudomonas alcaligenes TaxID=43263 RepID=A0A2V4KJS1_AQUAC|nr:hypothetical protein [Pseudomonas alcaligenes]PYC20239.1 hypothetical protein DMO17_18755 [Pseudomonas alcaligenes]
MDNVLLAPGDKTERNGGSFQECTINPYSGSLTGRYGRYCTIRDFEKAPPTSKPGRYWLQIFKTPDNTE